MQKLLLLLLGTVLFSATVVAQISLTPVNMPVNGTIVVNRDADSVWITRQNLGTPGANKTWNFTNITPLAGSANVATTYIPPAGTPFLSEFPGATLVGREGSGDEASYSYFQTSATQFSIMGNASATNKAKFTPPVVGFRLPATYQTKATGTTMAVIDIGVADATGMLNDTMEVDAWGRVTTPLGTFDALRVKRTQTGTLTVFGSIPLTFRNLIYEWWTTQYRAPVFSYNLIDINVVGLQRLQTLGGNYLVSTTSSARDFQNLPAAVTFTPNPVNDHTVMTVKTDVSEPADLFIYNVSGQLVRTETGIQLNAGENRQDLPLGTLAPGTYVAILQGKTRVLGRQEFVKTF
jgi:hypothetical protein